jgi:Protein of unknown function (DUF1203)
MPLTVEALPAALAADAERTFRDDGGGAPLRCCLRDSRVGERNALVLVTPPGPAGAYSESGPAFLHADGCDGCDEPWIPRGVPRSPPGVPSVRRKRLHRGW